MTRSRPLWSTLLRGAAIVAVATALYFFARGMDGHMLLAALRDASPAPLALAAVASFSTLFWKSLCWRVMLAATYPVPVTRIFRYTIAAFASSLLVPARAGEALRIWLLKRRDAVPVTAATGVALAEKLVDGMAMIITVSPTLFLVPDLPSWVGRSIAILVAGALVAVFVLVVARRRASPTGLIGRLAAGMTAFSTPRTFAMALGVCLISWLADFGSVCLVLSAVGVKVDPGVALLILLGVNVAILIPSMPGNLGALEVGAVAALELVGVPRAPAMAFAILYHAVQVIPLLAAGLLDMRFALAGRPEAEPALSVEP